MQSRKCDTYFPVVRQIPKINQMLSIRGDHEARSSAKLSRKIKKLGNGDSKSRGNVRNYYGPNQSAKIIQNLKGEKNEEPIKNVQRSGHVRSCQVMSGQVRSLP